MLLEIENLTGGYHDTNVVFDVSAHIESGKILGVFGRNGVGKTTLARLVQGGLPTGQGEIRLDGRSVRDLHALVIEYFDAIANPYGEFVGLALAWN